MPLEPDDIAELADDVAAADKSVTSNGRSATSHDLTQLIAYEKHRRQADAETAAASTAHFGLPMRVMRPGGCG